LSNFARRKFGKLKTSYGYAKALMPAAEEK